VTPTNPGPWLIAGLSARMVELHALTGAKELTMGEIANMLTSEFRASLGDSDVTRNAVIGRCRRLGLPARPSPLPPVKTARVKAGKPLRIDAPIVPLEALVALKEQGDALTIYQLDNDTCKFPLGEVSDYPPYLFCGKPTKREGVSYCAAHYSRCHVRARVEWV
jgi:hypothetical protein